MAIRKNTLLLFSKLPETGRVKTRLSTLKDGYFTPEDAARLYEAMFLDVVDICISAFDKMIVAQNSNIAASIEAPPDLHMFANANGIAQSEGILDTYELVVSVAPSENAQAMKELLRKVEVRGSWRGEIKVITDSGSTFDEHYNDAFEQVFEDGCDCILSMGADMPALTVWDVIRGFMALHKLSETEDGGIVIAPDQEMGVSIIGWTLSTEFDHDGVFYNRDGLTVLPAYIAKAKKLNLPAIYLPPVPDVDTMRDFMHNITLVEALNYCATFDGNKAPSRTQKLLVELGCDEVRVPPNELHDPRDGIDI